MTLVRQGAANGVAVPSRSESVKWINEAELDERWIDGQSLLFVFWCIWSLRGGTLEKLLRQSATVRKLRKKGATRKTSKRESRS